MYLFLSLKARQSSILWSILCHFHLLYHCCHSLSHTAICCQSLPLVVTRCTTRLSFYKQSSILRKFGVMLQTFILSKLSLANNRCHLHNFFSFTEFSKSSDLLFYITLDLTCFPVLTNANTFTLIPSSFCNNKKYPAVYAWNYLRLSFWRKFYLKDIKYYFLPNFILNLFNLFLELKLFYIVFK